MINLGGGYILKNDNKIMKNDNKILRNGNLGYALKFDGLNDFVSIPTIAAYQFQPLDPFSISAFFTQTSYTNDNGSTLQTILGQSDDHHLLLRVDNGTIRVLFGDWDPLFASSEVIRVVTTGTVSLNRMHHVVVTKRSGSISASDINIYVDGALVNKTVEINNALIAPIVYGANFYVGASYIATEQFKGYIHSLQMYNVELTEDQIEDIYTSEGTIDAALAANVVINLPFDEKSGAVATDKSASLNNGTLTSFATTALGATNPHVDSYTLTPIER